MTMPPQIPSGQITVGDLYTELRSLNTNVTIALTKLEVIDSRTDTTSKDHEFRIRKLEENIAIAAGKALATRLWSGGLGAVMGAIVSAVITHVTH